MDYRTAKQRVDEILDHEDAEREWFLEARRNTRNPARVVAHEVGELYSRWLNFGPSGLTKAEMHRLKSVGPKFGFRGHTVVKAERD